MFSAKSRRTCRTQSRVGLPGAIPSRLATASYEMVIIVCFRIRFNRRLSTLFSGSIPQKGAYPFFAYLLDVEPLHVEIADAHFSRVVGAGHHSYLAMCRVTKSPGHPRVT